MPACKILPKVKQPVRGTNKEKKKKRITQVDKPVQTSPSFPWPISQAYGTPASPADWLRGRVMSFKHHLQMCV